MTTDTRPAIRVVGMRKTYGRTVAVDEVSFEVHEGEIFGLIGPNGAGKTTTMECVEGRATAAGPPATPTTCSTSSVCQRNATPGS